MAQVELLFNKIFVLILTLASGSFGGSFQNVQYSINNSIEAQSDASLKPFFKIGQNYYYIDYTKVNWYEAVHRCRSKNAHLASIETEDELNAISDYLIGKGYTNDLFWLSGNDLARKGRYQWLSTGEDFSYTKWSPNQPDNHGNHEDCVNLWVHEGSYYMNDDTCTTPQSFYICELTTQQLTIKIW